KYLGIQPFSMSMPKRLLGKSRTWPMLATTSKSGPRYLLIVLALAGDSTITRFFFFRAATARFLGVFAACGFALVMRANSQTAIGRTVAIVLPNRLATIAILG